MTEEQELVRDGLQIVCQLARANDRIAVLEAELKTAREAWNITPLALAQEFHRIYESLAPAFGYETRKETREFSPSSQNGQLMVAVCREIIRQRRIP